MVLAYEPARFHLSPDQILRTVYITIFGPDCGTIKIWSGPNGICKRGHYFEEEQDCLSGDMNPLKKSKCWDLMPPLAPALPISSTPTIDRGGMAGLHQGIRKNEIRVQFPTYESQIC